MADKILEVSGSDSLPDTLKVHIQMEMPYDVAIKILDLLQTLPPDPETEAPTAEA